MDLFERDSFRNLLPRDGIVNYHGPILTPDEARVYYHSLLRDIPWRSDEMVMFGKRIVTARKVAWYGDSDFSYTYSGTTKQALPWTAELAALKSLVEQRSAASYNACLLNLYHDGSEGMGWHSDDEKTIVRDSAIASVSLGAEREFRLKHKRTDDKVCVLLEEGSLLVMMGTTQTHWLHCIPKSRKIQAPRINLTFRKMAPA